MWPPHVMSLFVSWECGRATCLWPPKKHAMSIPPPLIVHVCSSLAFGLILLVHPTRDTMDQTQSKSFIRRKLRKDAKAAQLAAATPKQSAKRASGERPPPPPPPPPPRAFAAATTATATVTVTATATATATATVTAEKMGEQHIWTPQSWETYGNLVSSGVDPFIAARVACIPDRDWGVISPPLS